MAPRLWGSSTPSHKTRKGGSFLARAAASRSSSAAYSTSAARAATPWCSAPPHSFCSLWAGTFLTTAPACLANCGVVAGGRCRQAVRQVNGIRRAAAFQQLGHGVFAPDQGVLGAVSGSAAGRRPARESRGVCSIFSSVCPCGVCRQGYRNHHFGRPPALGPGGAASAGGRGQKTACRRPSDGRKPRADTARVLYRLKYNTFCRFVP